MGMQKKRTLSAALKILIGIVYAFPVIMCILFSFQNNADINRSPLHLFTASPTLNNYLYVLKNIPVWTYLKNSLIMVVMTVPVQIILASLGAFAFAFFDFKGKNLLFTVFISTMMIPGEVTIIAKYMMIQEWGMMNTYIGLTIISLVGAGGIFLLRQNMMALPRELWEAALLDGCAAMKYFWKIVLPMCKPIIASMVITSFIGMYNSYFWPLLVTTKSEFYTVQMGVAQLVGEAAYGYGYVLAGAVLSMLIPVGMFIIGQDSIVEGMTAGAVKS